MQTGNIALNSSATSPVLEPRNKAEQQKNQFLQLLVAQLKGQNPLDPKDGTEFVSQLAQFSSLEELINIRSLLANLSTAAETASENQSATTRLF